MKKQSYSSIFLLALALSAKADVRSALIRNQFIAPDEETLAALQNFDETDYKGGVAATHSGKSIDIQPKSMKVTTSNWQYKFDWATQDFERGPDLRMNQIYFDKKEKTIETRSTTFSDQSIRSITTCRGSLIDSGTTDKEVFCATATKRTCEKVLDAWKKVRSKAGKPYAKENLQSHITTAEKCLPVIEDYAKVLQAFSDNYADNSDVMNQREKIISQEEKQIKETLKSVEGGAAIRRNYVNSLKAGEFANVKEKLTSSASGLYQISQFLDLCNENKNFFPDYTDGPSAATSPDKGDSKKRGAAKK